jgi:hypothetical protein
MKSSCLGFLFRWSAELSQCGPLSITRRRKNLAVERIEARGRGVEAEALLALKANNDTGSLIGNFDNIGV